MRRRDVLGVLGGTAVWPFTARAQQLTPVIGFLSTSSPQLYATRENAYRQGLNEVGFVDGQNVTIDFRWTEGRNDRLKDIAVDLVRRPVSTIFASGEPAVLAAKSATASIPIVFVGGSDPVRLGLVERLSQPGGNITGATILNATMAPKRLQLLKELLPSATQVDALLDASSPSSEHQAKELPDAARALGLKIEISHIDRMADIEAAFERFSQRRTAGVLIGSSARFNSLSARLGAASANYKVPTIYQTREFTAAGGLASYGGSFADAYRIAGSYSGRILKGEKPASLPIQQATKVEMSINLKTAKALGLSVPLPLLGRADEVFE